MKDRLILAMTGGNGYEKHEDEVPQNGSGNVADGAGGKGRSDAADHRTHRGRGLQSLVKSMYFHLCGAGRHPE